MIFINIRKQLGDFKIDAKFEAQTRGIVALFGQSGSGKTSIINMIAGLLVPDHGHIEIDGRVLYSAENGTNLKIEHRRVGYVFQESRLFPHTQCHKGLLSVCPRRDMRRIGNGQAIISQNFRERKALSYLDF